jgi:pimeloyl-ACP methyl ester carboxylesterase
MLQGNGGGGQFVQRFALLHPEKVMAVAVNSANGFVAPNENAVKIPWLVTNITSDTNAADSTAFVAQLREASVKPVVRSYGEMARKVVGQVDSGEVDTIDRDFLAFYDGMLRVKLGHRSRQHKARRAKGLIH